MRGRRRRSFGVGLSRLGERDLVNGAQCQAVSVLERLLGFEGITSAAQLAQKVTVRVEDQEVIIGGDTILLIEQIVPLQKQIIAISWRPRHNYGRNRF